MDVRLTSEQQQLRDAAAKLADDLGPGSVAELDDLASNRAAGQADRADRLAVAALRRGIGGGSRHRRRGVRPGVGRRAVPRAGAGRRPGPAVGRRRGSATVVDGAARCRRCPRLPSRRWNCATATVLAADLGEAHAIADLTRIGATIRRAASRSANSAREAATRWHALALVATTADLVGTSRGALALACEYAKIREQYGNTDRLLPGRRAPAGRKPDADRRFGQHPAPRRLGGRRTADPPRRCAPPGSPRCTAPAPPGPSARPRYRCTAASATPGNAWRTSICDVR